MVWLVSSLSALAGFCAKLADEFSEGHLKGPLPLTALCAILYGALTALLSLSTPLSSLFIALALASLLGGKIDHYLHLIGLGVFAFALFGGPMSAFNPWLFSLFLLTGLLDELALPLGPLRPLGAQRLWVPLAALTIFIFSGVWLFLAAILSFDISYRLAGVWASRSPLPSPLSPLSPPLPRRPMRPRGGKK